MEVHLVDATYELFRAGVGAPPRKAPDGREVGAVRGVAGSLAGMLRNEGATHVGCATDHVIESFRNDLYPFYKTGQGLAPELVAQFQLLEDFLRAMGFVVWPMVEFEADDAIAAGCAKFAARADKVVLATVDKDLAQCVSGDHVIMSDRRRKQTMNEAGVIEKFGVAPRQIPDYLALVGDSADGYPGIPGWGAKSAAAILRAHGDLEHIPLDPSEWGAKLRGAATLAANLAERREEVRLYKKLATLRADAPIPEAYEDLEWRGPKPELDALVAELGFGDFAERFAETRRMLERKST
jgi:5'-3' exonuclease